MSSYFWSGTISYWKASNTTAWPLLIVGLQYQLFKRIKREKFIFWGFVCLLFVFCHWCYPLYTDSPIFIHKCVFFLLEGIETSLMQDDMILINEGLFTNVDLWSPYHYLRIGHVHVTRHVGHESSDDICFRQFNRWPSATENITWNCLPLMGFVAFFNHMCMGFWYILYTRYIWHS